MVDESLFIDAGLLVMNYSTKPAGFLSNLNNHTGILTCPSYAFSLYLNNDNNDKQ